MCKIRIERAGLGAVLVTMVAMMSSCALMGDDDTAGIAVRGTAAGVLEPLSLELRHDSGSELLSIAKDGPFAFKTHLDEGDSYTVTLVGAPPCVLDGATGVGVGETAEIALFCDGVAQLTQLIISGTPATELGFASDQLTYQVDVPLHQQSIKVTATAAYADARITVQGMAVASGVPSEPVALALGDNVVSIDVIHASGLERAYQVIVHRAAELAQVAYGKASNTGAYDQFGVSVALDGDTLAVGAPGEESAATGIDGDQADNSAGSSGAVYVFQRSGDDWQQQAYIKASNTEASDWFGSSVALDGDTLVVGADGEDSAATGIDGDQADNSAGASGAVYVFRQSVDDWHQQAYVKASNTGANDRFGWSVALDGDTLAVGALGEESAATGIDGDEADNSAAASGAVYVFQRSGDDWQQQAYVKASNTDAEDYFGVTVALHGDTLAVGAPYESSAATGIGGDEADNSAAQSGAVYVFQRSGDEWQQQAYVKPSNTDPYDWFGYAVALHGDALAVSAPYESSAATGIDGDEADNSASASGAVYVLRRSGATWQQQSYIKASNTGAEDYFGASVALGADTLAVGAHYEDSAATGVGGNQADDSAINSGAVYLFY